MFEPSHIQEHMDVISSDLKVVGKVDHLEGADAIKLTQVLLQAKHITLFRHRGSITSINTFI